MNIPFVVETVLHDGLLKYKFKNSKIRSITTKPGKSKGAIFAYRSKKSMIGGRGVVLTSEEAIHENQDTFTHWTPNVYRYGTYADENRSYTKGHSENNLRQINTFFIDFDIHTEKETISASDILTTAIDLGFMPTLIIKSDKGYQAYFVLETPVYVTSKSEFKSVKAAKIISQNIREYFGKSLPVDLTCNHFGIARIPRTDNVEFFDPNYRYSFKEWQDWSFKQTDNKGFTRSSLTVLSGTEGKKQVDEPWFNLLLHETKFSGEKGLVGRNSVMFTLSLAYFSSGYSIETCEYNMFGITKTGSFNEIFLTAGSLFPTILLILSIMLPFILKFGGEKGRIAIIGVMGFIFVIGLLLIKTTEYLGIDLYVLINKLPKFEPLVYIILFLLLSVVILGISYLISLTILKKKEF